MGMLNKDASISVASMNNEDDERASLAAYYRQSMTQQVKVNVTPVVQKSSLVQNSSTVEVDDLNDHGGYWDENPDVNRGNEEENYWDENPEVNHEMHEAENYWY